LHRKHKFSLPIEEFSCRTTKLNAGRPELDFAQVAAERQSYKHNTICKERERERDKPHPQKRDKKRGKRRRESNIPILFGKMSSFSMQLFQNENKN